MDTALLLIIAITLIGSLFRKQKITLSEKEEITITEIPSFPYSIIFQRIAKNWNIPLRDIVAIVDVESEFEPKAINYEKKADIIKGHDVDSIGLGQILYPDTALALDPAATRDKLMQPEYNLNLVGKLWNQLLRRYPKRSSDGFAGEATAAYNAGSARYNSEGFFVNQNYVDKVRSKYNKWKDLTLLT